ncbi:MAG: phage portal protein [Erythrobacter sp.]|nr:phage portal protein [Erythrobacter sp.]MDZ4272976.1 phage portal protein [Erythrobacter sp.]MDZ4276132.1 phage portal protein [Erythrobacter sp.]
MTPSNTGGNFLTKALARVTTSLTQMRHAAQSLFFGGLLKRTRFDYVREVGDMLDASVVMAPIMWLQRALPEAALALRERKAGGKTEPVDEHPMLELIRNPNPFYGDIALWAATILSFATDGNAYWVKVRNRAGVPAELWYVPHWMIKPKAGFDGAEFLSHYEYTPGTGFGIEYLPVEDVVHFRHGINPRDLRLGLSPMLGVIREIFSDMESSNFVASLLRNMGVPGVVISPKGGAMQAPEDVEATKTWFKESFGGDNRGGTLVMGAPTDVQPYGFNPQQMNLSEARDVAEERVCAALGIPAAVVGFGAGLQQTQVGATMEEMRKLAWHNGVLPLGRALADELQRSLLPDFQHSNNRRRLELFWDTADVLALQEDENKTTERKLKEFQAGAIMLYDYLTETGRDADENHKFYRVPISTIDVPAAEIGQSQTPPPSLDPALESEAEPTKRLLAPQSKGASHRCTTCGTDVEKADDLIEGICAACHDKAPDPDHSSQPRKMVKDDRGEPHDHGPLANARIASPEAIARGERFALTLQRQQRGLQRAFERDLMPLFEGWGDTASRIAFDVLRASGEKAFNEKADPDLIQQIIDLLNLEAWQQRLSSKYQAQYLGIARKVAETLEEAGFGTGLPDPLMREIIATGGRRAGLVDVPAQTRQAIFDALAEGRALGEGAQALANRIANQVEGGHWSNAETRARVIARTETKFAQNISTIENARANGVSEFVVFDGRLGPGRSKPDHIARNGSIVSTERAVEMAVLEHPNGTLSFAPHFSL